MAAIVIRENARVTWLTGVVGVRAKACRIVQRGVAYVAAAVLICVAVLALLQLVAEILSFPAPIAVTAITLIAAALLNSLRRNMRTQARHRYGPGNPHGADMERSG
jgi:4-hydroxybenzoate polyprenyltransferase